MVVGRSLEGGGAILGIEGSDMIFAGGVSFNGVIRCTCCTISSSVVYTYALICGKKKRRIVQPQNQAVRTTCNGDVVFASLGENGVYLLVGFMAG